MTRSKSVDWITIGVMLFCYLAWGLGTTVLYAHSSFLGFVLVTLMVTLHSSLQHEVLHGHPLPSRRMSELLVYPALGLLVPYERFRETHLKHHHDPNLTDPYEDPETNYLDPEVWEDLSKPIQRILLINNTLLGRILLGPAISMIYFIKGDIREYREGNDRIPISWLHHAIGAIPVILWILSVGAMPIATYVFAAYLGFGLLKIRTFLEHRAHEQPRGRTVVVNDRGLFAFLFLNNNFHLVHHMQPEVSWYKLPKLFDEDRERYLSRNDGYVYKNYMEIFRRYAFLRKDPVPHPLWDKMREKQEKCRFNA